MLSFFAWYPSTTVCCLYHAASNDLRGGQFYQQLSYYAYDLRIYTTYTGIRNIFVIFPIHYCYKQYGFMIYLRDERNIFVSGYRAVGVGEGIRTAHHDQMKPLICLSSRCGGVGRVE